MIDHNTTNILDIFRFSEFDCNISVTQFPMGTVPQFSSGPVCLKMVSIVGSLAL